jgi:CDP-diacylglycerol---glycerol-3-phosphate 3-phosphatidyltransferase
MQTAQQQSPAAILGTITMELDKVAPRFEIESENVDILKSPVEFFECLKVGVRFLFIELWQYCARAWN